MGKSNSIEEQSNQNKAFQDYIVQQNQALDQMANEADDKIKATIAEYYKDGKWDDAAPLIKGSYRNLMTVSEWSLDNVSKMIDAVRDAIFGKPAPEGSTKTALPDTLAKNLMQMAGMELLITTAAFTAIQGILSTFASGTQTDVRTDYETKEILPGLTLFLCIIENQYHRSDFLNDNTIVENLYIFDTRFSSKQAGDIAKFNQVQSLIGEQEAIEVLLAKINALLDALDPSQEGFEKSYNMYRAMQARQNDDIKDLKQKIDELRTPAALAA